MIATLPRLMSVTLVEHNDHFPSEPLQLPTVLYCSNILCITMDPSLVSDNAVNLFKVSHLTVCQEPQITKMIIIISDGNQPFAADFQRDCRTNSSEISKTDRESTGGMDMIFVLFSFTTK